MSHTKTLEPQKLSRYVGWSLLGTIITGIATTVFLLRGIDINLTADIAGTAENMLGAELRLRAKGYIAALVFALEAVIGVGLYLLLRAYGQLLAGWALFMSLAASTLVLLGGMFAMNAAQIASFSGTGILESEAQRLDLAGLQAISDYTSFHLGLIIATASNAGFFYLFLKSNLIPKIISGWGVFASVFVVSTIVARDFIPALGHNAITGAFMLSNLVAIVSLGVYLSIWGVRRT